MTSVGFGVTRPRTCCFRQNNNTLGKNTGDFRVNEEGGPKIEFLTKAKWERSSHVLGGLGACPPGKIFGFQSIQNAI